MTSTQKPLEWVSALITRLEEQLPVKKGPLTSQTRDLIQQSKTCLVNVSKHKFSVVIAGLIKMLQAVNSMRSCSEIDLFESQCIILKTLEECLNEQPRDTRRIDEVAYVKLIIQETCQFLTQTVDSSQTLQLKEHASKVLHELSISNFNAVFARISARLNSLDLESGQELWPSDTTDIELIQHIHMDLPSLQKLLREITLHKPLKKDGNAVLIASVEKAIWNWIDSYPEQFTALQQAADDELTELCDKLFDQLDAFAAESTKRKALVWPLQMMLLILCPKILEEIYNASNGAPCSTKHLKKKKYFEDAIKKSLCSGVNHQSGGKHQLLTSACVAGVKLCKATTYLNSSDSTNVFFKLTQSIIHDLQNILFTSSKPLFKPTMTGDLEDNVMIDFFVSFFRLKPHSNDLFKACLTLQNLTYQLVLVMALYKIAMQPRLPWWPMIDLAYSRSNDLRSMFNDAINRISQNASNLMQISALSASGHMPLKVTQSLQKMGQLTCKFKDKASGSSNYSGSDESLILRQLMYWLLRLMHKEPMIFLHQSSAYRLDLDAHENSNSTSELINGCWSLVSQCGNMTDIVQVAMEALLCLHQPENIRMWNTESPLTAMQTFWYISSQIMFKVSLKLLHHQMNNYVEVLRWLRDLLVSRNQYLLQNRDMANLGSGEHICKQAAVKLETVAFMYLWSLESEAVLTALSMFRLFCDEAEIRSSGDSSELPPEYVVHVELANSCNIQAVGTTRYLKMYPKSRSAASGSDEAFQESWRRTVAYRTSRSNPEHELEDIVNEWANMTGFLCALGCVSVTHSHSPRASAAGSTLSLDSRRNYSVAPPLASTLNSSGSQEYCPLSMTEFLKQLLSLLTVQSERVGVSIQKNTKELLSYELNTALFPILFDQIRSFTDKFFEHTTGRVVLMDANTQFLEHIIYVMRNVLTDGLESGSASNDSRKDGTVCNITCIELIMIAIVRYVRYLDPSQHTIMIKTKLCHLVEAIMKRKDDLVFRQEIRFRNKLVEYLTEWVMGAGSSSGHHHAATVPSPDNNTHHSRVFCIKMQNAM